MQTIIDAFSSKPALYLAHPYTGDERDNALRSLAIAETLMAIGFAVRNPLLTHFHAERYHGHDWDFWMRQAAGLMRGIDVLYRGPGSSRGADIEELIANEHDIPIVRTYEEARAFLDKWKRAGHGYPPTDHPDIFPND